MMASFQGILKDLKNKKYEQVYLLHGEEPYFIDEIAKYVANHVLTPSEKDFNMTVFYGKDAQVDNIRAALNKYPMMASHQVVILKEAQDFKKLDELTSYMDHPVPSTIFVVCYKHKKIDKRTRFYKKAKDHALLFESKKLREERIPEWIVKFLQVKGYSISDKAALLLTEHLGTDLEKIANEIEKLLLDTSIDKNIDESAIERNIGISKDYNIFELQAALSSKDIVKATRILNYFQANPKANPIQMVVVMLHNFFARSYALHLTNGKAGDDVMRKIGIPYPAKKDHYQAVKNYRHKLADVIGIIQDIELRTKGIGSVNANTSELMKELFFRILYV